MISRAKVLFEDWHERQGLGVKAARPMPVFAACLALAQHKCSVAGLDVRSVILSAADITKCEERALSSARVAKFGPVPRDEESWRHQIAEVRAEMYATTNRQEAAE
jgi:hypothetical protein